MSQNTNQQKANFYLVSGLIILVLMVIIIVQNTDPVEFKLILWRVEAPLIIMFLAMFIAGFFYGQIRSFFSNRNLRKDLKEKEMLIKKLTEGGKQATQSSQQKPLKSSGTSTSDEVKNPS